MEKRININAILGELFPTADLTDPEEVRALAQAIRDNPGKVNEAMRAIAARASQEAADGE